MKKTILLFLPAIVLIAAGCNSQQQASAPATAPVAANSAPSRTPSPTLTPANPTTTPSASPLIGIAPSQIKPASSAMTMIELGSNDQYLTATNGMTLYTYSKDTAGTSNCNDGCASSWPPYITLSTEIKLGAAPGIIGTVGSITRADGSAQITYKGIPLYFWTGDQKPGDATGNQVNGFSLAKP